jgi:hypothetical protein
MRRKAQRRFEKFGFKERSMRTPWYKDASAFFLLGANLLTIALALLRDWSVMQVMWIFWVQSITIGAFSFLRMWNVPHFSTKGLTSNGKRVLETVGGKQGIAIFFALHYGFFHFGYLIFLIVFTLISGESLNVPAILILSFIFFANHLYSYQYNQNRDAKKVKNLGYMMLWPYLRVIPMHMAIVLGFALQSSFGLILFLALKAVFDWIMHLTEHKA